MANRSTRIWQDSLAHATVYEGDATECAKWIGWAKQKLQFMLHSRAGSSMEEFYPAEGVRIRVDTRPNRIMIASSGGIVFVFTDTDGGLSFVKPDFTLGRLPAEKYTVYRHFSPAPQNGAICLKVPGVKTWVVTGKVISIVASKHTSAAYPFEQLDGSTGFNYAAPSLFIEKNQKLTLLDIFNTQGAQSFSSIPNLLSVSAIKITKDARYLFTQGVQTTGMRKEFTGLYTDNTYHADGLVPFSFREHGLLNETLRLSVLVNNPNSTPLGSASGALEVESSGDLSTRESAPSLLAFAASSMGVLTHKYFPTDSTHLRSFCVSVSIAKSDTTLWARRLRIYKIMINSSLIETSRNVLLEFQLTQRAIEHATGSVNTSLYNRDVNSVLGGYHLTEWYDGEVLNSYLGFIKKECSYSTEPIPPGTPGVYSNSLTETVKAIRINLISGAIVEKVLDTRTITQVNDVTSGGTAAIEAGSWHLTELYYADFINDVYVIGGYHFPATFTVPGENWHSGASWKTLVYTDQPTYELESSNAAVYYNPTLFEGSPLPDGYQWYPWALDNSLRDSAYTITGLSASFQHFQSRRVSGTTTKGVFTTNAVGRNVSPKTAAKSYFIETADGATTITYLRTEAEGFNQTPAMLTL